MDLILPSVPQAGEVEVSRALDAVIKARQEGPDAREVADRYFFETVVEIHRVGEGVLDTGLKPAGLGHDPVVPVGERAIATGSPDALVALLTGLLSGPIDLIRRAVSHLSYQQHRHIHTAQRGQN